MNKWIEEALQAPRDAWGLLLGLASAFSILALLHNQFESEPMRVVMDSWRMWSHQAWSMVGNFLHIDIGRYRAVLLTACILNWAVLLRGAARSQLVWPGNNGLIVLLALVCGGAATALLADAATAPFPNEMAQGDGSPLIVLAMLLAVVSAFAFAPRSFFGVVIAGILLLLIDRIPILPAASTP